MSGLATIDAALAALREGRPVIVADDEGRENEGDVILAAETASQEWVAWTVRNSSGLICAPMTAEIADRLQLPPMVAVNEDRRGTAYTVTVDAADGVTTGISAADRATTLRVLADPASGPASVRRPGHVLPLRAVPGGVRERAGHTEAAIELLLLAGLRPVAAIAEIVAEDGEMARMPQLLKLGAREGVPVVTIEQLVRYLDAAEAGTGTDASSAAGQRTVAAQESTLAAQPEAPAPRIRFEVETRVPTAGGVFRVRAYRDLETGADHMAWVADPPPGASAPPVVRVHSECITGEAFGSLKCECGPQLQAALARVQGEGGAVVYLRGHEGRGIGLVNKLRAYALQERGLDTLDANLELGLPADAREYRAAAAIIAELGLGPVRLLSNNPEKLRQLTAAGIEVVGLEPLVVGVGELNGAYLDAKRDRMGHLLPSSEELAGLGLLTTRGDRG